MKEKDRKSGNGKKGEESVGGAKREKKNICLYPSYF